MDGLIIRILHDTHYHTTFFCTGDTARRISHLWVISTVEFLAFNKCELGKSNKKAYWIGLPKTWGDIGILDSLLGQAFLFFWGGGSNVASRPLRQEIQVRVCCTEHSLNERLLCSLDGRYGPAFLL